MGRTAFLWTALMLLFAKASIFVLGQSVFLIGSRENLVLSICTDVINVAVGVLAVLRMRDAGRSGALGFFGCLVSSYGSLLFLVFSLQLNHVALNRISLGSINVVSQLTLLIFVISIGRIPGAGRPVEMAAEAPAAGLLTERRAMAPSLEIPERNEGSGLPMAWTANPDGRRRWKPLLVLAVFVVMGIFVVVIGHPFVGASNIACFGYLLFMGARKAAALRKIGPGRITLTADGFFDDRLDRILVPWRSVTRHVVRTETKAGVIAGVLVISNFERMRDVVTKDYKYAYLFSASSKNICLFIDVDGVEGAERITETVTRLIQKAR